MKIFFYLCSILFLFIFSSCNDQATNPSESGSGFQGYQDSEASQNMTLATLSYTNENNPAYLKDSLIIQLANQSYATGGKWTLDWGPCLSPDGGNMMYVAKNISTTPVSYCIALRGTDWCFPFNWKEDIGSIEFDAYPYGGTDDSISHGALYGLDILLAMIDSTSGKSLITYLNGVSVSDSMKNQMYITGHSLGGMLATVLSAWFLDVGYSSKFSLNTYTFAAPSCGNEQFVQHYESIFRAADAECHRVENPNDLVHYFNGDITHVLVDQIPTKIPTAVEVVLVAMDAYFLHYNMHYKHVGIRHALQVPVTTSCSYPSGSIDQYACYVAFNHTTSTYLKLLNAPPVNIVTVPCKWEDPR